MVKYRTREEYLHSKENIEKLRRNRANQIVSPSKGKKIWKNKQHPRGMLGHKHSIETRKKMGSPGKLNPMYGVRLEENVLRMKLNNPMKNPDVARKVHNTVKLRYASGELEENRKRQSEMMKRLFKDPEFIKRYIEGFCRKYG